MTRHGELNTTKNILLKTAVVMIKQEGMEGFSARKLASRCGLTHQVPYRYFRNKEDLMGSVIAEILTQMSIYISAMVKKRKDEEPFLVLCEESIRFLVRNPNFGILIYSDEGGRKASKCIVEHFRCRRFDFEEIAKDYFRRCEVPEEKYADVFDVINTMLPGLATRMINKGIVVEGDLKPVIRVIIEDVLHLKVKEQ